MIRNKKEEARNIAISATVFFSIVAGMTVYDLTPHAESQNDIPATSAYIIGKGVAADRIPDDNHVLLVETEHMADAARADVKDKPFLAPMTFPQREIHLGVTMHAGEMNSVEVFAKRLRPVIDSWEAKGNDISTIVIDITGYPDLQPDLLKTFTPAVKKELGGQYSIDYLVPPTFLTPQTTAFDYWKDASVAQVIFTYNEKNEIPYNDMHYGFRVIVGSGFDYANEGRKIAEEAKSLGGFIDQLSPSASPGQSQ